MKKFKIGYIVLGLVILFPMIATIFKFQFFDDRDAKNFLTGLSIALFLKILGLHNKISKLEENKHI